MHHFRILNLTLAQIDNLGFGRERRQQLNEKVLNETLGFR
jgi:hypothetical protein